MRTNKEQKMIAELEKLRERVFSKLKIGNDIISQKIGRTAEKFSSVSRFYDISYVPFTFDMKYSGRIK